MKTFKQFLNESYLDDDYQKLLSSLLTCTDFLNDIKINADTNSTPIFRGIRYGYNYDELYLKKSVRSDRKPLTSSYDKYFNFITNIGLELITHEEELRKRSIFCSKNAKDAATYGSLSFIFPENGYSVISSILSDSYEGINTTEFIREIEKAESLSKIEYGKDVNLLEMINDFVDDEKQSFTISELRKHFGEYSDIILEKISKFMSRFSYKKYDDINQVGKYSEMMIYDVKNYFTVSDFRLHIYYTRFIDYELVSYSINDAQVRFNRLIKDIREKK